MFVFFYTKDCYGNNKMTNHTVGSSWVEELESGSSADCVCKESYGKVRRHCVPRSKLQYLLFIVKFMLKLF